MAANDEKPFSYGNPPQNSKEEFFGDGWSVRKTNVGADEIGSLLERGKLLAFVDSKVVSGADNAVGIAGHWVHVDDVFTRNGQKWVRVFDSGRGGYYDQLLDSFITRTAQVPDNPFTLAIPY